MPGEAPPHTPASVPGQRLQDAETPGQPATTRDGLSFIHSSLDDAGLAPAEFRVYCHVNRRAGRASVCNESLSNIAEKCDYCAEVVRAALKRLTSLNMLRKNCRVGETTEYRLNPPKQWKGDALTPLRKNPRGSIISETNPAKKSHHHPSEKVVGKGIPDEGIPKKVLKDESNKGAVVVKDLHPGLTDLMTECREVLGAAEMDRSHCHARWLKRAETEPDRLRRVLADTRNKTRENGLDNPAAWAETMWKEFK